MDFHSLSRKELQALCKKNKIAANITNIAMADALQSLETVEGLDEFINALRSDPQLSPEKTVPGSPDAPPTAPRGSIRRKPANVETESSQPLTRTRRATRRTVAVEADQENKNANLPETPAMPATRRRAAATSTRKKAEAKVLESGEEEKVLPSNMMETPAVQSNRRRAPVASGREKMEAQKEGKSVQRVYGTRQSVRILAKSMADLSLKPKGEVEAVKMEMVDGDEKKADPGANLLKEKSGERSETINNSQILTYRNLDQSMEDEIERSNDLQQEINNSDNEHEVDDCNPNFKLSSQNCNNLDRLSGLDGEDNDDSLDESKFKFETSDEAVDCHAPIDGNGPYFLFSGDSFTSDAALQSGGEEDVNRNQSSLTVEVSDDSALVMEIEKTSIDNTQDEVSAEIMHHVLAAESFTSSQINNKAVDIEVSASDSLSPMISSQTNTMDALQSKPDKTLSDDVEGYCNCAPIVHEDVVNENSGRGEESSGNPQFILQNKKCKEFSEDNLVDVDVTEVGEVDISRDSANKLSPKLSEVMGSENLVDVLVMQAEELPSTFDNSENRKEAEKTQVFEQYENCKEFAVDKTPATKSYQPQSAGSENLVDVLVMQAEEWPSTFDKSGNREEAEKPQLFEQYENCKEFAVDKTPASTKSHQPQSAGETVTSPFAADTLQGQFPRPSQSIPRKSSVETQMSIGMMMVNHPLEVNKENIDNSSRKLEAGKNEMKKSAVGEEISVELSMRMLRKMLKEKLQISNKKNGEKEERTRLALQPVSENCMVGAEAESEN